MLQHLPTLTLYGAVSMIIYSIYKFTNKHNGKIYIGFTKNFNKRLKSHLECKENDHFHNALKKYGLSSFDYQIIYQSKDGYHTLNFMETHFIKEYDSYNFGYNLTLGGEGILGYKHNTDTIQKLKKDKTNKHKENLKISRNKRTDKPNLGKKRSEEWKINHGIKLTGRTLENNKKPVITPDGYFDSVTSCAKFYNHNIYYMSRKIKNNPDFFKRY